MRVRLSPGLLSLFLVSLVFAGCVGPDQETEDEDRGIDHAAIARQIGDPIEVKHEHDDHDHPDHWGGVNMELVSWNTLDVTLGENGFANFVFYEDEDEDLAFVAIDGDTRAGFVIVDTSDPRNVTVLGSYFMAGNSVQEVRVTSDGRYALMNVQALPNQERVLGTSSPQDCTICLHLLDVSDRTAPVWVDALPVDNFGTHNMHVHVIDGTTYVFYVGQPASYQFPGNAPGNYIGVAQIVDGPAGTKLVKVGEWRDPAVFDEPEGRAFPHDVLVYEHPLTKQHIGYLSYWDAGAVTIDFSDPTNPKTLDQNTDLGGSGILSVHWFAPEQKVRSDGRLIAWSAPEIDELQSDSGAIRAYDVTDPANIALIGSWFLPGNVTIPGQYVFSGHTTVDDPDRGLLAVSHYHAGVWILDITEPEDPRHLAYYMPNGNGTAPYDGEIWWKKPNFSPDGFAPNVYQSRWKDDLLWVTERGTGFYVLEYTGPVPGPLA